MSKYGCMPYTSAATVNLMNFKLSQVLSLASISQWCNRNNFQIQNTCAYIWREYSKLLVIIQWREEPEKKALGQQVFLLIIGYIVLCLKKFRN